MKETSFVYQGKRGLFCILGKKRANYSEIGLRSGRSAASEPLFCFQWQEQQENAGVLFAFLYSYKETQKVLRRRESNRIFTKKPVK